MHVSKKSKDVDPRECFVGQLKDLQVMLWIISEPGKKLILVGFNMEKLVR